MNKNWRKGIKHGSDLCKKAMVTFLKDQGSTLLTIGLSSGFIILCKALNVPITMAPTTSGYGSISNHSFDFDMMSYPNNAIETAIKVMVENAMQMNWDSEKIHTAIKIRDLVKDREGELDDDTLSYVIKALSKLEKTMSWGSSKDQINTIITSILKEA